MAETEPVVTEFRVETDDLETGTEVARKSLREYGNEVERTEGRQFRLVRSSTNLLQSVLAIRGAFSITERTLERFGLLSDGVSTALMGVETALQTVVVALQVYRAVSGLATAQFFLQAKAAFLAAIATASASSLFLGTAAAIAASLAAWAIISSLSTPNAQFGGIVPSRPGGTLVRVGEAGHSEAIIPLESRRGRGGFRDININIERVETNDPDELMRKLGRRVQQLRVAGF